MSMKDWEHLKIPFEKIDTATEKFKTCIGRGGYGRVYKGVLSIDGKDTTIAVKRLNEWFGQGIKEFLTEIQLLSDQEHPNLISLLGYCDEGKEKIIVYEYAAHGSLDRYIRFRNRDETSTILTWLRRLNICANAACGLNHLHNHIGGHRTIIHRDIKSSNILIDENWVAKISDLGLSKLSVTGFGMSLIVSNGCGTHGYCEPEYYTSGIVTKKSDVYSFGIVLFEVLCGRLCIIEPDDNGFILSRTSVKEYYNNGNWVKIIDPSLSEHMGSYSMTKFSEIAYRCLHDDREQRPAMDIVAKELEETLNFHVAHELEGKRKHQAYDKNEDEYWEKMLPHNYPHLIRMSDIPLRYTNKKELYLLFCHGILANNGQLWFSTCKSTTRICSILPSTHVLFKDFNYKRLETLSLPDSRFKEVKKLGTHYFYVLTCRLESFMFSPHCDYACYLVFKLKDGQFLSNDGLVFKAKYSLGGNVITVPTLKRKEETGSSKSIDRGSGMSKHYVDSTRSWVEKRDDGWLEARLTNPLLKHHMENLKELEVDLYKIEGGSLNGIIVEGVEFRPVVGSYLMAERSANHNIIGTTHLHGTSDHDKNEEDKYWEKRLPHDYPDLIDMSDIPLNYTTKKELYLIFCRGFLANNGQLWFSTSKSTRGICSMLPSTHVLFKNSNYKRLETLSLSESRFKRVMKLGSDICYILTCRLESYMFSPNHYNYACYLVFKFEDGHVLSNEGPMFEAKYNLGGNDVTIPILKTKEETGSSKSIDGGPGMSKHNYMDSEKSWVEKRDDGWLEVRLTKPLLKHHHLQIREELKVTLSQVMGGSFNGIIVEGLKCRPVIVSHGRR